MIQFSSLPALTHSSLLLCVFGILMSLVLLREQRRLVDTSAAAAVSIVTSFYLVTSIKLDL